MGLEGNIGECGKISGRSAAEEKPAREIWGLLTSMDVEGCDPALIRSAEAIREYTFRLCQLIKMRPFGECHVVHFGEQEKVAGFSMFQLIETSNISGHFANATNTAYIDIFSCRMYDPQVAVEFTKEFFKGTSYRVHVTERY